MRSIAVAAVLLLAPDLCAQLVFGPPELAGVSVAGERAHMATDVNGDGHLDVLSTHGFGPPTVAVHLGQGDGTFVAGAGVTLPLSFKARDVAAADLDLDGFVDLALISFQTSPFNIQVVGGLGDGSFGPAVTKKGGGASLHSLVVGDLDGDAQPELVVAREYEYGASDAAVLVLHNLGALVFGSPAVLDAAGSSSVGSSGSRWPALADVDLDGDLDIVAWEYYGLHLHRNEGGLVFAPVMPALSAGAYMSPDDDVPEQLLDLDSDGVPDVVYEGDCDVVRALGDGTGVFAEALVAEDVFESDCLVTADFDGDGTLDVGGIQIEPPGLMHVAAWANDGSGVLQVPAHVTLGSSADGSTVAGDFDEDGRADVATFTPDGLALLMSRGATYPPGSSFTDLGQAHPGEIAYANILLSGHAGPGGSLVVEVFGATTGAPLFLVAGGALSDLVVHGHIPLVPTPDLIIGPFEVPATGTVSVVGNVPAATPSGTIIYLQAWVVEALATYGPASTSGVAIVVP
jgi:hypothetical protein